MVQTLLYTGIIYYIILISSKSQNRHIIKLGLAFTLIVFFPISGCLQETILKSYEQKSGVTISAYLSQAIQCISGKDYKCIEIALMVRYINLKTSV